MTNMGQNVSSEIDADQGEGNRDQLKFAVKQLNDRVHFSTSPVSGDEYNDFMSMIKC